MSRGTERRGKSNMKDTAKRFMPVTRAETKRAAKRPFEDGGTGERNQNERSG